MPLCSSFNPQSSRFWCLLHRSTMRKIDLLIELKPPFGHHIRRRNNRHSAAGAVAEAQLYVARRKEDESGAGFLKLVGAVDQRARCLLLVVGCPGQRGENIEPLTLSAIRR